MKKIFSISEMKDANPRKKFSEISYLYYVGTQADLGGDFARALTEVLDPTFTVLDGLTLVDSIGAPELYKEYTSKGVPNEDAQYWANHMETTEIFGPVDDAIAQRLADVIVLSWSRSLQLKRPGTKEYVRVEHNPLDGEIFVILTSREL